MKIRYEFVTGEISEVEVTEELGAAIEAMERKAGLKDRAETRRHTSLNRLLDDGAQFVDVADVERTTMLSIDVSALLCAVGQLQPQQRELVRNVYFEGRSFADIARDEGISEYAVRDRLARVHVKIRKTLK